MIRKLNEQERKLCKQGIKNRKLTIKELTKELNYFEDFNKFNRKHKDYLESREKKAKEKKRLVLDATLNQLIDSIKHEKEVIKLEQKQLDNGVEVKENKMTGVT